jgi:hypothetical protein
VFVTTFQRKILASVYHEDGTVCSMTMVNYGFCNGVKDILTLLGIYAGQIGG